MDPRQFHNCPEDGAVVHTGSPYSRDNETEHLDPPGQKVLEVLVHVELPS